MKVGSKMPSVDGSCGGFKEPKKERLKRLRKERTTKKVIQAKKPDKDVYCLMREKIDKIPIGKWTVTDCKYQVQSEPHCRFGSYNDYFGCSEPDEHWTTYQHKLEFSATTKLDRDYSIKISAENNGETTSDECPFSNARINILVDSINIQHSSMQSFARSLCERIYSHYKNTEKEKAKREQEEQENKKREEDITRQKNERTKLESLIRNIR